MREARQALIGVALFVGLARAGAATDVPDPALLEFLGATSRLEASGVDVDRLVTERLARGRPGAPVPADGEREGANADAAENDR